jgi:hypothetical protein
VTSQLNSGGTITISHSSITARACTAWEFTVGSGNVVTVGGSNTSAVDNADAGSVTISSLTNREWLFVHAVAHEGVNGDSFTASTNYTGMTGNGTTGGGGASNMSVRAEFRILTGTSDSVDPTYTSADHAQQYVALKEDAPGVNNRRVITVN